MVRVFIILAALQFLMVACFCVQDNAYTEDQAALDKVCVSCGRMHCA